MTKRAPRRAASFDRARAEQYWGDERRRLGDDFRIVLSAGERPFVNAAYHRWETEALLRDLPRRKSARILDLACGLGRVSRVLFEKGYTVIGADNAMAMLQTAKRKSKSWKGIRSGRSRSGWCQSMSSRLPFQDGGFDVVVCFGLLEHLPASLQKETLREALRVLRRGGRLYLVLNNNHSFLLRQGQDNAYRRAEQLANGYFCGLVDRRALIAGLERAGNRVRVLGSNAHYALLRHSLRSVELTSKEAADAAKGFDEATTRDLDDSDAGWLGETCADHFLYRIERTSSR